MTAGGAPRPTILIIEDDETIRETLTQILEDEGYVAVAAADGRLALSYLETCETAPNLIMLDLMMPTMSGLEFHAELRRDARYGTTPVLLVSADATVSEKARGIAHVAALKKPFDVDMLLATVGKLCPRAT